MQLSRVCKSCIMNYTIELDSPTLSASIRMPGRFNNVPKTGTRLKKFTATGKKPLNRRKKPYISTHMPITGQPSRTIKMPPAKKPVAFALCFWKKNLNVLSKPITKARPQMNRILPIARRPLSKNISIPMNKNAIPNPAKPTPIF